MRKFKVTFFTGDLRCDRDNKHEFYNRWTADGRDFEVDSTDYSVAMAKAREIIQDEMDTNFSLMCQCVRHEKSYAAISHEGEVWWIIPFKVASVTRTEVTF